MGVQNVEAALPDGGEAVPGGVGQQLLLQCAPCGSGIAALKDGENTIVAKGTGAEDTITLNGVAEHNADYTLPDIAAAMAVGNWFDDIADDDDSDEIIVVDGCYSIEDTCGELFANEECLKIAKGWLMSKGNLTLSSMLTTVRDMMGFKKLTELSSLGGFDQKDLAQLNRQLSKVKK